MSTLITPHFALPEFACHSGEDYPREWIDSRLIPLCNALEAIRTELAARVGRPVPLAVISGYRSPAWNERVGGAKASQHLAGRAADVRPNGCPVALLHQVARELHDRGAIRIGGLGRYPGWVHLDVRPGAQIATWSGGGVGAEVA